MAVARDPEWKDTFEGTMYTSVFRFLERIDGPPPQLPTHWTPSVEPPSKKVSDLASHSFLLVNSDTFVLLGTISKYVSHME